MNDDERHRREEAERKAKRKLARASKAGSSQLSEKERKRREHAQKFVTQKKKPPPPPKGGKDKAKGKSKDPESSLFQSLFAQRAQGYMIDFKFRNAPPRPPVGPVFIGEGIDGELKKWAKYRPHNSVEREHVWKLHHEPDLGVRLAPSAMDPSCYLDPTKSGIPTLHPDDEAILNWKGSMGDTRAEEIKILRERRRAAARAAAAGGKLNLTPSKTEAKIQLKRQKPSSGGRGPGSNKKEFSRVLDEKMPFYMKKTTYLSNDYSKRVHAFTSLAETKDKAARDLQAKQSEMSKKRSADAISKTFDTCLPPAGGGLRQHPTKRELKPIADIPLLPNVENWGHAYTHVVIDNPPKEVGTEKQRNEIISKLDKAFIANVEKRQANRGMICDLLVEEKQEKESTGDFYKPVQEYDLEVIPLKDEDIPHVNFALWISPKNNTATYLPIPSRVQLSTGRPADKYAGGNNIHKRHMTTKDIEDMELRQAEVDADLADKYNDRGAADVAMATSEATKAMAAPASTEQEKMNGKASATAEDEKKDVEDKDDEEFGNTF